MNILEKFKETSLSVIPIVLIVSLLHFTFAPLPLQTYFSFLLGSVFIIVGLSLFLLGSDISIIPFGQLVGSALVKQRKTTLMLLSGLIVGIVITVAEPQVQILASQIIHFNPSISSLSLIIAIAAGVGLFIVISFLRILLKISFKWTIIFGYIIIALIAYIGDTQFIPIAFDAGGATTGPMTVPFILALGIGVSTVRKDAKSEENSFGLVGIASMGPILAVLLIPLFSSQKESAPLAESEQLISLGALFLSSFLEVVQSMAPLILLFILFHFTLLHMQRRQIIHSIQGMLYTIIGLVIFLVGVNGTLIPVGSALGSLLATINPPIILIVIGLFFGAVVVLAEPAVWVLTEQIRSVSGGTISQRLVLLFFSMGVSLAVGLAMARIVYSIPLTFILAPGYIIALLLSFFSPPLFCAIAFDSGGVASGPLSSAFLLSFALGISSVRGGNPFSDGFGIVALVAMTPLITLQLLGIIYKKQANRTKSQEEPHAE